MCTHKVFFYIHAVSKKNPQLTFFFFHRRCCSSQPWNLTTKRHQHPQRAPPSNDLVKESVWSRSIFTSLWSSVEPAGFVCYQCYSVFLIFAAIKGNHLVSVTWSTSKQWRMLFSCLLYFLSHLLRPRLSVKRHFNPQSSRPWMDGIWSGSHLWSAVVCRPEWNIFEYTMRFFKGSLILATK